MKEPGITTPNKKWLTVSELAKYLSCSESCIYHKACAGEIPFSKKLGRLRFDRERIDVWMTEDAFDPKHLEKWRN